LLFAGAARYARQGLCRPWTRYASSNTLQLRPVFLSHHSDVLTKVLLAAVVIIAILAVLRFVRKHENTKDAVAKVLGTVGPARCLAAIKVVTALKQEANLRATVAVWDAIELPLVQALPDCPPSAKPILMNALDALAKATANRELAKRVMTLRNGLMS